MRAMPLGAFFHNDLAKLTAEARLSAEITHTHPEGQAGAIATAAATALAYGTIDWSTYLTSVADLTPDGQVRTGIKKAASMRGAEALAAGTTLGLGEQVSAQDTVPFALWCVAECEGHFERSLRLAFSVCLCETDSDCDTIGAMVGGITAVTGRGWAAGWEASVETLS
jgi:ADP-ribosylglycohydrolase